MPNLPKKTDGLDIVSEHISVKSTIKGKGMVKAEGDVVASIKAQVDELNKRENIAKKAAEIKKSSWLQVLEKERQDKADREKAERQARAARLANLFEDQDVVSNGDDEVLLDFGAADHNNADFLAKIDNHLQVEKRILEAW